MYDAERDLLATAESFVHYWHILTKNLFSTAKRLTVSHVMKFIDREGIGVGTTMTSVSPTSMSQKVPRNEQEVQLSQKDRAMLDVIKCFASHSTSFKMTPLSRV